jgi:hypothetical protein
VTYVGTSDLHGSSRRRCASLPCLSVVRVARQRPHLARHVQPAAGEDKLNDRLHRGCAIGWSRGMAGRRRPTPVHREGQLRHPRHADHGRVGVARRPGSRARPARGSGRGALRDARSTRENAYVLSRMGDRDPQRAGRPKRFIEVRRKGCVRSPSIERRCSKPWEGLETMLEDSAPGARAGAHAPRSRRLRARAA